MTFVSLLWLQKTRPVLHSSSLEFIYSCSTFYTLSHHIFFYLPKIVEPWVRSITSSWSDLIFQVFLLNVYKYIGIYFCLWKNLLSKKYKKFEWNNLPKVYNIKLSSIPNILWPLCSFQQIFLFLARLLYFARIFLFSAFCTWALETVKIFCHVQVIYKNEGRGKKELDKINWLFELNFT
jgi:hypothetical protein